MLWVYRQKVQEGKPMLHSANQRSARRHDTRLASDDPTLSSPAFSAAFLGWIIQNGFSEAGAFFFTKHD